MRMRENTITSRGRKILDFMLVRRNGLSDSFPYKTTGLYLYPTLVK